LCSGRRPWRRSRGARRVRPFSSRDSRPRTCSPRPAWRPRRRAAHRFPRLRLGRSRVAQRRRCLRPSRRPQPPRRRPSRRPPPPPRPRRQMSSRRLSLYLDDCPARRQQRRHPYRKPRRAHARGGRCAKPAASCGMDRRPNTWEADTIGRSSRQCPMAAQCRRRPLPWRTRPIRGAATRPNERPALT
jgi:hypothetical protein